MDRDSWATPLPVYLALDREFDFKADICASSDNAKHPHYLTIEDDTLNSKTLAGLIKHIPAGGYVWCNPPYSNISPWIKQAHKLSVHGIGTVLLVMADSSVGWYYEALQHCSEIREVVKGRISFINPATGKTGKGNSKGSLFIVFDPYGRQTHPKRTYVLRDTLLSEGYSIMQPDG